MLFFINSEYILKHLITIFYRYYITLLTGDLSLSANCGIRFSIDWILIYVFRVLLIEWNIFEVYCIIFVVYVFQLNTVLRSSQLSLGSQIDMESRQMFARVGTFKGNIVAVKKLDKKSVELTRTVRKELKLVSSSLFTLVVYYSRRCACNYTIYYWRVNYLLYIVACSLGCNLEFITRD